MRLQHVVQAAAGGHLQSSNGLQPGECVCVCVRAYPVKSVGTPAVCLQVLFHLPVAALAASHWCGADLMNAPPRWFKAHAQGVELVVCARIRRPCEKLIASVVQYYLCTTGWSAHVVHVIHVAHACGSASLCIALGEDMDEYDTEGVIVS